MILLCHKLVVNGGDEMFKRTTTVNFVMIDKKIFKRNGGET